jgi:1-acyl-sn-glycerol-3-phosphate acyltransferase
MGLLRRIVYFGKALILFVGMVIIALFVVIFGMPWWGNPKLNLVFIRIFSIFACKLIGIHLIKVDQHKILSRRPAVLIGNHQSALDFALIGSVSPEYSVVVGKKEILYLPVIGWYFKVAGNLFIDRSNARDAHLRFSRLADLMVEKNLDVSIFPEGTRNKISNTELLPFKKGAFHIAFSKGLPIVPVVCSSLKNIAVWERFELGGGTVIVKVLDPIDTAGVPIEQINEFIEGVRSLMQSEMDQMNEQIKTRHS